MEMETARLTELRLTRFKSFRDAVVPLDGLTVLTGRNSSGKSNILDALDVLSRLATPGRLDDSLDGGSRREGGSVRGGSRGLAPYGESSFELGCTVRASDESDAVDYLYDIKVEVDPEPRVVREDLRLRDVGQAQKSVSILSAKISADEQRLDVVLGRELKFSLARTGTALSFFGAFDVEVDSPNRRAHEGVKVGAEVLRNAVVFSVDVGRVRDYVSVDRLNVEPGMANLSAVAYFMKEGHPDLFDDLEGLAKEVAGCPVEALDFVTADGGKEVMLAIKESGGWITDARSMSDGLLRFLGVATVLLFSPHIVRDRVPGLSGVNSGCVLAVEEIENGLHPSHVLRLFELVEKAAERAGVSVIISTHSPALLDVVGGGHAKDVLVCHDGQVTSMPDLPGYDRAMARGTLGRVIAQGLLTGPAEDEQADYSEFMRLIGVDV